MAVAAGRRLMAAAGSAGAASPQVLTLATSTPVYADKTNATAVHAALRLDEDVLAADLGGALRSGMAALLLALRSDTVTLNIAADVRSGLPESADELACGDGAAALLTGTADDGELLAEFVSSASATAEFVDRWRAPGELRSRQWEDRFIAGQYRPLAERATKQALASAGLGIDEVDHLIVVGMHGRTAQTVARGLGPRQEAVVDDRSRSVGITGTAHPLLLLVDTLEQATAGQTILLVCLADGADALVVRRTAAPINAAPGSTVAEQVTCGDDSLSYADFLAWRGVIKREPARRPDAARVSASAAARSTDWKFGFVGGRDEATGLLHLPPPASDSVPVPMADVAATVATFTVDHVAQSMSPPTIFAVLDFDGGGRYPCELTDVHAADVRVGDRVEMVFRLVSVADGLRNYFWKARPGTQTSDGGEG